MDYLLQLLRLVVVCLRMSDSRLEGVAIYVYFFKASVVHGDIEMASNNKSTK